MTTELPSSDRRTALRRGVLFIVVTSPIWLMPRRFPVFKPVAVLGVMIGVTLLFLWWDNRSPSVLGLDLQPRRPVELLGGMLGGAALMVVTALLLRGVLPFDWSRNATFVPMLALSSCLYFLLSGAVEELIFRGYAFEQLISSIGLWPAQLVVAIPFAAYHLLNGWSWQSALTGTVIGSVLFGLVFARTRSLWASTGFHAAANWVRELTLTDPPTKKTWFGPVAQRAWTVHERETAMIVFDVVAVLFCALLYWSIRRRDRAIREAPASPRTPRHSATSTPR